MQERDLGIYEPRLPTPWQRPSSPSDRNRSAAQRRPGNPSLPSCGMGGGRGKFGWQALLEPCCKCTRTEMADDEDFARHATLMDSMTRAPAEGPILRWWKDKAELLRDAFTDEALRRMARKAGVESATQKGALAVNDELRSLALLMLSNLCDKAEIIADYRDSRTITISILRAALEFLDVKIDTYHEPGEGGVFPSCGSHRKERVARGARAKRGTGAQKEIEHEANNTDCVYTQRLPFIRLLKDLLGRHGGTKVSPESASWIQFIIESLLIDLLHKTGYVVQQVTKGHAEDKPSRPASPKRKAINARDIQACVQIFKHCWPILAGRQQALKPAEKGRRGGVSRVGGGRGRGGSGRGRGGSGRARGGSGRGRGGEARAESRAGKAAARRSRTDNAIGRALRDSIKREHDD